MLKTKAEIRKAFWAEFADLKRKRVKIGNALQHGATTRTAFNDWLDGLLKAGQVKSGLARRLESKGMTL